MNYQTRPCPVCGKVSALKLNPQSYEKWLAGSFVQDAFPDLSDGERELLLTGMHQPCWDITFPPEDA